MCMLYVMVVVIFVEWLVVVSVINVPCSLVSVAVLILVGWLLDKFIFGWLLVIGGGLKVIYDLVLLSMFVGVWLFEEWVGE